MSAPVGICCAKSICRSLPHRRAPSKPLPRCRSLGISGVPFFIFSNGSQDEGEDSEGLPLSGAQPTAAFVAAAKKVLAGLEERRRK